MILALILLLVPGSAAAEQLRPETIAGFDRYVSLSEQQMTSEAFLGVDSLAPAERAAAIARLKSGEVITERLQTLDQNHPIFVPNGLIHHWRGSIFIPGVTLSRTLAFLQDYDHESRFYSPDVQQSKLIGRHGDHFKVFLRLRKTKVVTVILNTEYDVQYNRIDRARAISISRSTRIAEVENAGKPHESEKSVGNDSGFLWRLNSYWHFLEQDGGVYIQLDAISLTRDIPTGLGWLIGPFVTSIPKQSLVFTLTHTRLGLTR